jgi:hypothetical protein
MFGINDVFCSLKKNNREKHHFLLEAGGCAVCFITHHPPPQLSSYSACSGRLFCYLATLSIETLAVLPTVASLYEAEGYLSL